MSQIYSGINDTAESLPVNTFLPLNCMYVIPPALVGVCVCCYYAEICRSHRWCAPEANFVKCLDCMWNLQYTAAILRWTDRWFQSYNESSPLRPDRWKVYITETPSLFPPLCFSLQFSFLNGEHWLISLLCLELSGQLTLMICQRNLC